MIRGAHTTSVLLACSHTTPAAWLPSCCSILDDLDWKPESSVFTEVRALSLAH